MLRNLIAVSAGTLLLGACGDPPPPEMLKAPLAAEVDSSAFEKSYLDRLDDELFGPARNGQVRNVAFALLKDGQRVHSGFLGPHNAVNAATVDDHTLYRIYSMTKPVTAVAMLKLYEAGKFQLDDPVTDYVPEFAALQVLRRIDANGNPVSSPPARPATMRELLAHMAGFGYGAGRQDYVNARIDGEGVLRKSSSDAVISALVQIPLAYDPGADWQYSIASDVQGVIIERLSGKSLDAYLEAEIFAPLGMVDTGFWVEESDLSRLAPLTAWAPDTNRQELGVPEASMARVGLPFAAGGHGLVSTMADFERFLLMLANDGELDGVRILKPETVKLMTTNALPPAPSMESGERPIGPGYGLGYGFGVATVEDARLASLNVPDGTYYWEGAAGTWFWVDPENDIVFIGLLQNMSPHLRNLRKPAMMSVYRALN